MRPWFIAVRASLDILLDASNRGCAPWLSRYPLSALTGTWFVSGAAWAKLADESSNKIASTLHKKKQRGALRVGKKDKDKKVRSGGHKQLPIVLPCGRFVERIYYKYLKVQGILFNL